jgi:hypothetical protein
VQYRSVKLVVDPQILSSGDSPFDPLKLKAGEIGKQKNKTEKKCKCLKSRKKSVVGGLVGQIDEEYKNEIYKISKHG